MSSVNICNFYRIRVAILQNRSCHTPDTQNHLQTTSVIGTIEKSRFSGTLRGAVHMRSTFNDNNNNNANGICNCNKGCRISVVLAKRKNTFLKYLLYVSVIFFIFN